MSDGPENHAESARRQQEEEDKHNSGGFVGEGKEVDESRSDSVITPRNDDSLNKDNPHTSMEQPDDYFGPRIPLRESSSGFLASLTASEISSPLQSNSASSTSLQSSQASNDISSTQTAHALPFAGEVVSRSSGSLNSITYSAPPSRSSQATVHTRPMGPRFPNQSLAALHTQQQTLPYSWMRSRVSDYGPTQPASATAYRVPDPGQLGTVSRSADQTPLGSPGLFQLQKKPGVDAGSGQTSPSYLHPMQLHITPKETSKLIKDFDTTTGNKIMNNYEVLEKLGVGSHGAVKRARNLVTEEEVAIKIVRRYGKKGRLGKQESPEDKVKKEVAVLKKARHRNVVSLLEVIDDPEFGKVYLVLEYVKKGEIIWRTETTKDIADFEMQRYNRELAGNVDPEVEAELLANLNEKLHQHTAQKIATQAYQDANLAQEPLLQSRDQTTQTYLSSEDPDRSNTLHRFITGDHPDGEFVNSVAPYGDWSIESGGYEDLTDDERSRPGRLRRQRSAQTSNKSSEEAHTPKAQQQFSHVSENNPMFNLSASLIGSQYGPYDHDARPLQSSIINFQDILAGADEPKQQWTSEEDAFRHVPCLTMTQARKVFQDTVLGLEYLHFQGIIHRDIKPANLLWTSEYRVKISDFGVSYIGRPIRDIADDQDIQGGELDEEVELAKTVGTPAFYAPELCDPNLFDLEKTPVRPRITGAIDVWALGVTLYSMIYGRLPFSGDNQFEMFERIAWHEPFISSKRLRGVEEDWKMPMNSNKRLPNIVEYEEVDDTLKDLITRLLHKDPKRRITLKEVKYHPWVLQGVEDPTAWILENDLSQPGKTEKIEISQKDVQDAVAPLNLVDRLKHGIRRLGSVVRGRDSRRRAASNAKDPNNSSGSASSRASTLDREARRPSLRGDEQIYSALRASRETSDHPLSQSQVASPVADRGDGSYFVQPISHVEYPAPSPSSSFASRTSLQRPPAVTEWTAESIRTVRGLSGIDTVRANSPPVIAEVPPGPITSESAHSSSSGLSGILGLASRKLVNSMRSRDRMTTRSRDTSTASSRSSSYEQMASSFEEAHAFPSVALSPAVAAGQVEHQFLEPNDAISYHSPQSSLPRPMPITSPTAFEIAEEINIRRQIQEQEKPRSVSRIEGSCPPSPDDLASRPQTAGRSQPGQDKPLEQVSSDDQFVLSDTFSGPSAPSTSTNSSTSRVEPPASLLDTTDTLTAAKFHEERRKSIGFKSSSFEGESGYQGDGDDNGDGDGDEESDEEAGIMMMSRRRRS